MKMRYDPSRRWRLRRGANIFALMQLAHDFRYIGRGLYSLPDAERLTKIPRLRIRRWMEGYGYEYHGARRRSTAIVRSDLAREVGELTLTFADLMEVRLLDAFRKYGVSWNTIRIAAGRVRSVIDSTHPFSNKQFKTDGRNILFEISHPSQGKQLLDLAKNQWVMRSVVKGFLFAGMEFDTSDQPNLWVPIKGLRVVVDPQRAFGAPIVADGSVQTSVLAAAMYDVHVRAVQAAVTFERRLAA